MSARDRGKRTKEQRRLIAIREQRAERERAAKASHRNKVNPVKKWGHSPDPVDVPCPCGATALPKYGRDVYPHRPDLAGLHFYVCPTCTRRCGTHKGTWQPLGTPANAAERAARRAAHAHFDPLWRRDAAGETEGRAHFYRWLAEELKIPPERCHIGMFDVETARRAVELCKPQLERRGLKPDWR